MKYELYVLDCETTGLNSIKNDPIEISIYRLSNDEQRTWCLKPINFEHISEDALRVNKHKLEDLKGITKFGAEKYKDPKKVIVEIENWLMEDMLSSAERLMVGQNVGFDKGMLKELWNKCGSPDTFPFNEKYTMDTMQIAYFNDYCKDEFSEGYSLFALTKKHGIKNEAAHTAAADVRATVALFRKQVAETKKLFKNG